MSDSYDRAIPSAPGTYALLLRCRTARRIRIGHLGMLQLRPGWYAYVGSAFGPRGLAARIGHHQHAAARPHWHIDYLRRYARLESVFYCEDRRCEHEWAAAIGALPGALVPMPGFGSSDCQCETHLWWCGRNPVKGDATEFGFAGDASAQTIKVSYKGTVESPTTIQGTAVRAGFDDISEVVGDEEVIRA